MTDTEQKLRVGEWVVEPALLRLEREGVEKRVEPMVMDLLVLLIERAPDVVSRAEIFDLVWEGRAVVDATLSRAVSLLRPSARRRRVVPELHRDDREPRLPADRASRVRGAGRSRHAGASIAPLRDRHGHGVGDCARRRSRLPPAPAGRYRYGEPRSAPSPCCRSRSSRKAA